MVDEKHATDLEWFSSRDDKDSFRLMHMAAVYAIGVKGTNKVRIGWTADPRIRFDQIKTSLWRDVFWRDIRWTMGPPLAARVVEEVDRLLMAGKRKLLNSWYDVPDDFLGQTIAVAASNTRTEIFSHDEMMRRVRRAREQEVERAVRKASLRLVANHEG